MKYQIEDQAKVFLDQILSSTASVVQRDEMFKAFMGGFAEAFDFHTNVLTEMTDDEAVNALTEIHGQLTTFVGKLEDLCK